MTFRAIAPLPPANPTSATDLQQPGVDWFFWTSPIVSHGGDVPPLIGATTNRDQSVPDPLPQLIPQKRGEQLGNSLEDRGEQKWLGPLGRIETEAAETAKDRPDGQVVRSGSDC